VSAVICHCCLERICSGARSWDDCGTLREVVWTERVPRLEWYENCELHKWKCVANTVCLCL